MNINDFINPNLANLHLLNKKSHDFIDRLSELIKGCYNIITNQNDLMIEIDNYFKSIESLNLMRYETFSLIENIPDNINRLYAYNYTDKINYYIDDSIEELNHLLYLYEESEYNYNKLSDLLYDALLIITDDNKLSTYIVDDLKDHYIDLTRRIVKEVDCYRDKLKCFKEQF